ncbi:hypothetical protein BLAT2472_30442 [Burkholderia latens]
MLTKGAGRLIHVKQRAVPVVRATRFAVTQVKGRTAAFPRLMPHRPQPEPHAAPARRARRSER